MKIGPIHIGQADPEPCQVLAQVRRYIDRHGWDIAEDEERWQNYQRALLAKEYQDDEW